MELSINDIRKLKKEFELTEWYISNDVKHVKLSFFNRRVGRKHNRTTVVYRCVLTTPVITCGFKITGRAECAPGEEFNESIGFRIADDRAVSKAYKKAGDIIESLKLMLSADYDILNTGLRKCDRQCIHARVMEQEVIKELDRGDE